MAASSAQALYAFLTGRSAINAIVSGRVFRNGGAPPEEARTRVTYQSISCVRFDVLDGESGGLVKERFQLNCWGGGSEPGRAAIELASTISARYASGGINGFKGTISYNDDSSVAQTLVVVGLRIKDAGDLDVPAWDAGTKGAQASTMDIEITFRE